VYDAAMGWSAGQPTTKTTDKKDGGQALDLLTIALKADSNKPMHRESCKSQNRLVYTEDFLYKSLQSLGLHPTPNFDEVFVS